MAECSCGTHHDLMVISGTHLGQVGWAQEAWVQISTLRSFRFPNCRMGVQRDGAHQSPRLGSLILLVPSLSSQWWSSCVHNLQEAVCAKGNSPHP